MTFIQVTFEDYTYAWRGNDDDTIMNVSSYSLAFLHWHYRVSIIESPSLTFEQLSQQFETKNIYGKHYTLRTFQFTTYCHTEYGILEWVAFLLIGLGIVHVFQVLLRSILARHSLAWNSCVFDGTDNLPFMAEISTTQVPCSVRWTKIAICLKKRQWKRYNEKF